MPLSRSRATCICMFLATQAQAAETTFGSSEAEACYREALSPARATGTRVCTEAIEKGGLSPEDLAATYSNRGVIWARAGEVEKALADHNQALDLLPDSPGALINRANAYLRDQNYNDAIIDYDRAIELTGGTFAPAYFNRGWAYKRINDDKQALKDFDTAARLMPDNERYSHAVAETERQIREAREQARKKKREERKKRR